MKVKICGVQTVEAAKAIEESGADMIGFLFADSRRRVTVGEAEEIAGALGPGIRKVGVFVNAGKDEIDEAIRRAGLDYVQLHGDEDGDFAMSLDACIIKVFSHESACTFREMFSFPADFILIDSGSSGARGGTGRVFDWSALDHPDIDKERLILAGGLNAGNIRAAYSAVAPYAVDLSSGAETDGTKDPEKIKDIMSEVRSVNDGEDL
ncbi:phosphoribosylanthranilate isomerase [Salinicoccus carnicancri]|uniref:phosphoribosylanthranilate isomerase n=1 Tax=Salinicoccus carnicancri TaxID=558170 RepID=UPI0002FB813B|nr:phosphoribosylanthranilate isomerase [Salinicoccus carnicancri]